MASSKMLSLSLPQLLLALLAPILITATNSNHFAEYIGAEFKGVKFTDVPINSAVDFHFILAFAIDYKTSTSPPSPTNGKFNIFWDTTNLSPSAVSSIKQNNKNVKVALSIGGDTVSGHPVNFTPTSINSWVSNAVSSLTTIIQQYNLDGIDIDYEHFKSNPDTFAECIGQLVTNLKKNRVISFASIAPYDNETVQSHYQALWSKYGSVIDYVNFQFYAYSADTTVSQYVSHYDAQTSNYNGGKILASFATGETSGLSAETGFNACKSLKTEGKLQGIFLFSADDSKSGGFSIRDTDAETSGQCLVALDGIYDMLNILQFINPKFIVIL